MKQWERCYDDSWQGVIVPAAFQHPAKFSKGLVERIIDYMLEREWLHQGETIGDTFGGVGLGGIIAAYRKLRWVGVELETPFFHLGNQNFRKHSHRWDRLGCPRPVIIQGDSRRFDEIIRRADAMITSPPYVSGGHHDDVFGAWNVNSRGQKISKDGAGYGEADGQIGKMKEGSLHGVVTSPPFLRSHGGERGIMVNGLKTKDGRTHKGFKERQYCDADRAAGNIEAAKSGKLDAALTSPPYDVIAAGAGGLNTKPARKPGQQSGRKKGASQSADQHYGDAEGQIGRAKKGKVDAVLSGRIGVLKKQTYWEAMKEVYSAMHRSLKPGGYAAIVVKDFVRDGKRMTLCDDTIRLLVHVGFEFVERIHAMLTQEYEYDDLFEGTTKRRKDRKSFFRRNAERKMPEDDPRRIDWEEVIFVRKP